MPGPAMAFAAAAARARADAQRLGEEAAQPPRPKYSPPRYDPPPASHICQRCGQVTGGDLGRMPLCYDQLLEGQWDGLKEV